MREKLILWLGGAVLALAIYSGVQQYRIGVVKEEKDRLGSNQMALLSKVQHYRSSDSLNAAKVDRLVLTKDELNQANWGLVQTIEGLNIKLGRVQSAVVVGTKTDYQFQAPVRDSIVYRDKKPDSLKCVDYSNRYLSFIGCINARGMFSGNIASYDTLVPIIERVPKRWWFIKYGTKGVRLQVVNKNPFSKIICAEYYELK
jgi:hypothetical protein